MTHRRLLIIPAAAQAPCNALAKEYFDPAGGELTFTVPLFAEAAEDDSAPTHYWASAEISEGNLPLLGYLHAQTPGSYCEPYDADSDPAYPQRRLAELGLRTARPQIG